MLLCQLPRFSPHPDSTPTHIAVPTSDLKDPRTYPYDFGSANNAFLKANPPSCFPGPSPAPSAGV